MGNERIAALAASGTDQAEKADVILAGGGLAGCIAALRLAERGARVMIIEAADRICGNHTWSFHRTDIAPQDYERLRPAIGYEWPGQQVIFPEFRRTLSTPYASLTSDRLRDMVYATDGIDVRENSRIESVERDRVVLSDGSHLSAPCVIDSRGFAQSEGIRLGYQKFVGIELELGKAHGEDVPTIMDASVDQLDGYRFFYVLPMSETRLLIEDTRYSDTDSLDFDALHSDVLAYAANRGWVVKKSIRIEKGVLPITLAQDGKLFWDGFSDDEAPIGLRAALFHPTTGYSLPMAVVTANLLAGLKVPLTTLAARRAIHSHAKGLIRDQAFYRFLNRMLFQAAVPSRRYLVLQRFYRLPQSLIERFYAGDIRSADKVRILIGKPPVPIQKAVGCVSEARALAKERQVVNG